MSSSTEKKADAPSSTPPTAPARLAPTSDINELHARLHADPRFNPTPPSIWKRIALLVFAVTLLWLALHMRRPMRRPEVVQAQRYSTEHKFRPAASPVLTEYLPDGRVRVHGAQPTA